PRELTGDVQLRTLVPDITRSSLDQLRETRSMMPDDHRGKTVSRHAAVQTLCADLNRRPEPEMDAQRMSLVALDSADQGAFAGGTRAEEPDRPRNHAFAAAAILTVAEHRGRRLNSA